MKDVPEGESKEAHSIEGRTEDLESTVDALRIEIERRKQAEEEFRRSELRYRAIIEDQTDLICRFLPDMTLTFVNEACCRYFGKRREDLLGRSFMPLVFGEDRARLEKSIGSLSTKRPIRIIEHRVMSSKGPRWMEWTNRAIFNESGRIVEYQSVGRDITENKELESKLQQSYEDIRALVNSSEDIVIVIDPKGTILLINEYAATILGEKAEWLISRNITDFLPPDVAAHRMMHLEKALELGQAYHFEDKSRDRYFAHALYPVWDSEDNIARVILVARDITERCETEEGLRNTRSELESKIKIRTASLIGANKALQAEIEDRIKAEEELSLERKRFQILTENAPFGMALIGRDGVFRYLNPRFQELFGYNLSEIPNGREWFKKAYPDADQRHKAITAWIADFKELTSGEKKHRSFTITCKNGTEKIIRFILAKLDGEESLLTCEDITERKRFLQELRLAHQQLQDIIEFLPDATFVIDRDKKVIAWNRAIEEMTGMKKRDIIGKGNYSYGVPFYGTPRPILIDLISENNPEIEANYRYLKRTGFTLYGETCATNLPSGRKVVLWAKASPLLDSEGHIVGAVESIRDITEWKKSEEALEEANEKLQALIRASPLAIMTSDLEGQIQSWNAAAERIFGWKEAEILGHYPPIVPADRRHEFRALTEIAMQGKMFTGVELQRVKKDGSFIDISLSSAPIKDSSGRIRGIMSVMDDITKKKDADRLLRENFHFLQRLIDTIPNPIFYKDLGGRFHGCNLAFERSVNLSKDEIIGKTVHDIYPAEQADWLTESDEELLSNPGILVKETTLQLNDGQKMDAIFNWATYANEDGTLAGLVGVIIDITERKQAEAELRLAKDVAEEAARVKADFLANMSHEIRTPLNAVIGMTGLLLDAGLSPEHRDCVETIRSSGDTLLAIINDILDFSKIEGGSMELERQPFDLRQCIEESLDLNSARAAEKGLNLAYRMDDGTPEMIIGDLTRLRQIFVNLISNAVKFTESGEVVVLVNSRSLEKSYHELHFSVKDTGIGISAEHIGRLFRSFSQIDASTTRKYGGTGLGLAISRRLVELMGGKIWVQSEEGKGSIFHFTVVAEAKTCEPKPFMRSGHPKLTGKSVLIADGNWTNQNIVSHLILSWGMKPKKAFTAQDALDLARSEAFDAAIIGTGIEDMNILALASEIKQYQRDLPLILHTSFGQKKLDECNQFTYFLTRPIKPYQLYEAVKGIFDRDLTPKVSPASPKLSKSHHLRILLAEDNVVNQKVALRMLNKIGYRADLAANGLEVLQALERLHYDVILMDVQMPEMDGLEATRHIREKWPTTEQPRIIAVTAYALEGDKERCLNAGMDGYISKPMQIHELADALRGCPPLSQGLTRPVDILPIG